jgi:hypothetical protein
MTSGMAARPSSPRISVAASTAVSGSRSIATVAAPIPIAMAGTSERPGRWVLAGEEDVGGRVPGDLGVSDRQRADGEPSERGCPDDPSLSRCLQQPGHPADPADEDCGHEADDYCLPELRVVRSGEGRQVREGEGEGAAPGTVPSSDRLAGSRNRERPAA